MRIRAQCKIELERRLLVRATEGILRGDLRQALSDCTTALLANPRGVIARVNRGALRYLLGDPAGALRDLTATIGADPDCEIAYFDRGVIFLERGDFAAAERDFVQVLARVHGDAEVFTNRGIARYGLRKFEGALRDFEEALGLDAGAVLARFYRALLHGRGGRVRGAVEDLDLCLSEAPSDWPLRPTATILKRSFANGSGA